MFLKPQHIQVLPAFALDNHMDFSIIQLKAYKINILNLQMPTTAALWSGLAYSDPLVN